MTGSDGAERLWAVDPWENLRGAIRASGEEMCRHIDVFAERMHSALDGLLEQLSALHQKVDRFRAEFLEEFEKLDQRLARLEAPRRGCPRASSHPLRRRRGGWRCDA